MYCWLFFDLTENTVDTNDVPTPRWRWLFSEEVCSRFKAVDFRTNGRGGSTEPRQASAPRVRRESRFWKLTISNLLYLKCLRFSECFTFNTGVLLRSHAAAAAVAAAVQSQPVSTVQLKRVQISLTVILSIEDTIHSTSHFVYIPITLYSIPPLRAALSVDWIYYH